MPDHSDLHVVSANPPIPAQLGCGGMTKYHAQPVTIDGIRFASRAEAKRYGELKLLERADAIWKLEVQPSFPIAIDGKKICTYRADFSYYDSEGRTVEDVKSKPTRTPVYRLKAKLVKALYGFDIREIMT